MGLRILVLGLACLFFATAAGADCTIGLVLGTATRDGCPVIFKNRDITSWSLEFRTFTPAHAYAYVGNCYRGQSTVWMGVNEVGFGIVQSAAYNLPYGGSGLGNGTMMAFALERCVTVEDFAGIVDSTDVTGRATAANFAVVDAYGGGAMFECGRTTSARYEPDSLGIIVRANFAYIGDDGRVGLNRMERAHELLTQAALGDSLDALFVSKRVVADLYYPGQDPYPLPWTGSFPGMPAGYVNTGPFTGIQTICNFNTLASGVVQGVPLGYDPANTLMWCFFGQPALSVPLPIFPASHDEPPEAVGSPAPMCALAQEKSEAAFNDPTHEYWLDASHILDLYGDGVMTYAWPAMDWAHGLVAATIADWEIDPPSAIERADFQARLAADLYEIYDSGVLAGVATAEPSSAPVLEVFPNPFETSCLIRARAGQGRIEEIEIFDVNGRQVAGSPEALTWQPGPLQGAGIYLVRARIGGEVVSRRVIHLK